jgi:hypothetical protein
MLQKALDYRTKPGNNEKFIDIRYEDLIKDSIGQISEIYKMDGGLTQAHIDRFIQHETVHPHRKHGVHKYSLADFGLTETDIDGHTRHYQEFINSLSP